MFSVVFGILPQYPQVQGTSLYRIAPALNRPGNPFQAGSDRSQMPDPACPVQMAFGCVPDPPAMQDDLDDKQDQHQQRGQLVYHELSASLFFKGSVTGVPFQY